MRSLRLLAMLVLVPGLPYAAETLDSYYAHPAVLDAEGVIAPWYTGANGQLDFRIRVSAETLRRYPWVNTDQAVMAAPHFVYTSMWSIDENGVIGTPPINDWMCGDLGQRTVSLINGFADYYRYSGDAAAIGFITLQADYILSYGLTPENHAWPRFPISVPVKGKPYGACDPAGYIQLDLSADIGAAILRAYQLIGDARYFDAARHWGDLLAAHCRLEPGKAPWPRYANPEQAQWSNELAGSITMILRFLDQLIRLGYEGEGGAIVRARDAGRAYVENVLLPRWAAVDTWGRYYWDWECPVLSLVNVWAAQHLMDQHDAFPKWEKDARNILTLIINRAGVDPASAGEAYSGAWAVPESPSCCGLSLSYGQQLTAAGLAQYAALTGDSWSRELARRMAIMSSYDARDNGAVIDGLTGTPIVAGTWLNIIHPLAMRSMLQIMAWLPDLFGPSRENHIMRSTAEVTDVTYEKGCVAFTTFDAPADTRTVLRLAFVPKLIAVKEAELAPRETLSANGYTVQALSNGDCVVQIRHDGAKSVVIFGDDPQDVLDSANLTLSGMWSNVVSQNAFGGAVNASESAESAMSCTFTGNQVRVTGDVGPWGGLADVYVDGVLQRSGIDCWCPAERQRQVLFARSGLAEASHELRIVVKAAGNLRSEGKRVSIDSVQYSAAGGNAGFGTGGGPAIMQRMVFGYTGRDDLLDAQGHAWRPATEWVVRLGQGADSVASAWWSEPASAPIEATDSPDLYRYGAHAPDFVVNVTVAPGTYHATLKFAATRDAISEGDTMTVLINGAPVAEKLDVAAKAGGRNRAFDLTFNGIKPRNGVIEIRFSGDEGASGKRAEAFVHAIEVGPEPEPEK